MKDIIRHGLGCRGGWKVYDSTSYYATTRYHHHRRYRVCVVVVVTVIIETSVKYYCATE